MKVRRTDVDCNEPLGKSCWKNLASFFTTPIQKRHQGCGDLCWMYCGSSGANHFHIFGDCSVITLYWTQVCEHINYVFGSKIPCNFENVYFGNVNVTDWRQKDQRLLWILLAASKKAITRKWLKPDRRQLMTGLVQFKKSTPWKSFLLSSGLKGTSFTLSGQSGLSMWSP